MVTQEWKQGSSQKVTAITVVLKQDTQILVYSGSRADRWDGSVKESRREALLFACHSLKYISNCVLNILTALDKRRGKKVGSRK